MTIRFDVLTPAQIASLIALAALGALAAAWTFQGLGYAPCELCFLQRWPYYLATPVALASVFASPTGQRLGFAALTLLFVGGAVLALYHSGVEWKLWPGPSTCTGAATPKASSMDDFMKQLEAARVVRCDEAALRIFGLSFAGWNAILSSGLAALSLSGARRA